MKNLFLFAFASAIIAVGCRKYDDSNLQNRVGNLENRVAKLEELCSRLNTNIASLQTLVTALQNNDYITAVIPIINNGETIGYTITFAKSAPITIYHGTDGKDGEAGTDGYTPTIGVRQDADGIYYWTLDGNWLTDDNGNKIKAEGRDGEDGQNGVDGNNGSDGKDGQDGTDGKDGADGKDGQDGAQGPAGPKGEDGKNGQDGKDGITPQLKIEDDYWYISYDNGQSWDKLGKATGEKGKDGENGLNGDSIFSKVEDKEAEIVFTLTDGTEIKISKSTTAIELNVAFENIESINVLPDSTYEITYTIIGADESTIIDVVAQDNYKAYVEADDYASGKIIVKTPSAELEASRIIVLVSRGTSTIMRVINFVESIIIISDDAVIVDSDGDTVTIDIETNIDYIVDIPTNDRSWISVSETRSAVRKETLTFTIAANPDTASSRYSTVTLKDGFGNICQRILFTQKAASHKTIHVDTAGTLYTHISEKEKQNLSSLVITGTLNSSDYEFMGKMSGLNYVDLSRLDDTTIPAACFKNSSIETVILPSGLTTIPSYAFQNSKITSIDIPETVVGIGDYAFYNCTNIKGDLVVPDATLSIGASCFYGCTFDGSLHLGKKLDTIYPYCFYGCSHLSGDLVLPDNLRLIYNYAFYGCSGFAKHNLIIGENIVTIYSYAFIDNYYNPIQFSKVYIKKRYNTSIFIPDPLEDMISYVYPFGKYTSGYWNGAYYLLDYLGVPVGCKNQYKSSGYTVFRTIEEVQF